MEFTVSTFDDDMYENMTYDERRNFNLARNREMMALLFSGGSNAADTKDLERGALDVLPSTSADIVPNEPDPDTMIEDIIAKNNIFCREKEVLRLMQFLDKSLFPCQPMIIYGPAASGKSLLCKTALALITSSAHMTISCSAATSAKRFIQGMWLDALASISKFNKIQLNISSSFEEDTKIKTVSTFCDLVDRMASLMFCQAHILKQVNTTKVPGLIILIDHIDKVDELEDGLSRRLLSLDELCHPMIKVLAIGRSLPRSITPNCMMLQLRAYSDEQLVAILCNKINCEHRDSGTSAVDFKIFCEQALPQFTVTTRRVDEIWTMMRELYARRMESCARAEEGRAGSSSSSSGGPAGGGGGGVSSSIGAKRPLALDEEVRSLAMQPAVHMTSCGSGVNTIDMESLHGQQWCNHLPLKAKALALAAFLASRNPPATDRSTFGQATKGRRKKTRGDPDEAGGGGAGKIASSQPQCFGVERLLSIYKQILLSISASTLNMPVNKYRKNRNLVSAGEVDKTVSIFSVDARKQKHLNTKNEALLYTLINTLVKKKFLVVHAVATAGTKAVKLADSNHSLLYLCTLHGGGADELAQSIGFPLRDYLSC